jgi:hypothetical protein
MSSRSENETVKIRMKKQNIRTLQMCDRIQMQGNLEFFTFSIIVKMELKKHTLRNCSDCKMFSRRILWIMLSSGTLRLVAAVRTDVSVERIASIIRMTTIGELG